MTITFFVKPNKNKNAERGEPIFIYFRENYQTRTCFIGQRINPQYWDGRKSKAKKGYANEQLLNTFIHQYREKAIKFQLEYQTTHQDGSFHDACDYIIAKLQNKVSDDFFPSLDLYLSKIKETNKTAKYKKLIALKNLLLSLNDRYPLSFSYITANLQDFFDRFINFCAENNHQINSIRVETTLLKSFLTWIAEKEIYSINLAKLKSVESLKEAQKNYLALTLAEVKSIRDCELTADLDKVRDIFLFQIYTGQRYSDILGFTASQLNETCDVWTLRQKKGGTAKKRVSVPLIVPAQEILKKYNYQLNPIGITQADRSLKKIGRLAGLTEPMERETITLNGTKTETVPKYQLIGTHTARRTFATLALGGKLGEIATASVTGHSSPMMLSKYYQQNADTLRSSLGSIFAGKDDKI